MTERTRPILDAATRPAWEASKRRRLLLQRNPATGRYQWYPRGHAVDEMSRSPEWVEAAGSGVVHTFSVIHRAPTDAVAPPYVFAIVELDEGPRMATNIVGVKPEDVRIGMRVVIDFEPFADEQMLPVFRPAE